VQTHAQLNENFEDLTKFTGSCWYFSEIWGAQYDPAYPTIDYRITDNGSIITNPATNQSSTIEMMTPALNVAAPSLTVSFRYRMNVAIFSNSSRTIEVGLMDANGSYTYLDIITLDKNTPNPSTGNLYNKTFSPIATGLQRLVFRMGGDKGLGFIRIIFDDLYVSATPRYTTNGGCNSAPIAIDDNFIAPLMTAYSDNVITNTVGGTDNEPNGEAFSAVTLMSQPPASQGTVTIDNNGNFTFTPSPAFTGGLVTFTYRLTDNGYTPLTSNIATVTILYPSALLALPVRLTSFGGSLVNDKAQLKWSVAENEASSHFEVLKSSDGQHYNSAGIVFAKSKTGAESYTFADAAEIKQVTYYKLTLVNKNKSTSTSIVIALRPEAGKEGNSLTILKNPVESTLNFTYTSSANVASSVVIYNTAGMKVFSTKINSQKGLNTVSLSMDTRIVPGTYILEVVSSVERNVAKLIKR
jgi:hypothetical protein